MWRLRVDLRGEPGLGKVGGTQRRDLHVGVGALFVGPSGLAAEQRQGLAAFVLDEEMGVASARSEQMNEDSIGHAEQLII